MTRSEETAAAASWVSLLRGRVAEERAMAQTAMASGW